MKNAKTTLFSPTLLLLLSVCLGACGKIPSPYRGNYVDSATGARLQLDRSSGTLISANGRVLKADANSLDYQALSKGEAGIYLRSNSSNPDQIEVFWLTPKLESRHEEYGLIWFEAEVLYSRMDANAKNTVQSLEAIHCEDGMLMLDTPSKTWNGGCPAKRTDYHFVREGGSGK